jgi:hypothetical protein
MLIKVQIQFIKIITINVADKTPLLRVLLDVLFIITELRERVNNDTSNDGGKDEVDEDEVCEVEENSFGGNLVINPYGVDCEAVVEVSAHTVEKAITCHVIFKRVLSS